MIKRKLTVLATLPIIFAVAAVLIAPASVSAADCDGTPTFFEWNCDPAEEDQITPLFLTIFNFLAIGVSVAVVGGIIYGAITYMTAGGSPERAKKGLEIIRNAVIALVLYFAMFALLNFLVPGGLFSVMVRLL